MRARDLMTAPVITVQPWTSAKEAAELLSTHGFTALPVVDDDDPDRHVAQLPHAGRARRRHRRHRLCRSGAEPMNTIDPRITVGVDGSAGSTAALAWAAKTASLRHLQLRIVHGLQLTSLYYGGGLPGAGCRCVVRRDPGRR